MKTTKYKTMFVLIKKTLIRLLTDLVNGSIQRSEMYYSTNPY